MRSHRRSLARGARRGGVIIRQPMLLRIIYYRPDHRWLLQQFCWECDDAPPLFVRVNKFLRHWREERLAVIESVTLMSRVNAGWRREL